MKLALLGSTGSIGRQTLDVLTQLEGDWQVTALAAGRNVALLAEQARRVCPRVVCVAGPQEADALARLIPPTFEILHGPQGLFACASQSGAERVVNALVGAIGLPPTLEALNAGVDVALANKESLVIGGELVCQALQRGKARLLPIDSEHSALWQLLEGRSADEVERLLLTASGGALRAWPLDQLARATPADVLRHPNWRMGARITVDSATLVNKGFELVEAHWLFGVPLERIDAVLHPQSLVHGMVQLCDGAVLAHMGSPDMKVSIQYALTAPLRRARSAPGVEWKGLTLSFDAIDPKRYPAFAHVLQAAREGGTALAAVNAADEVLVSRFLQGQVPFTQIAVGIERVLERHTPQPASVEAVLEADRCARELAARA